MTAEAMHICTLIIHSSSTKDSQHQFFELIDGLNIFLFRRNGLARIELIVLPVSDASIKIRFNVFFEKRNHNTVFRLLLFVY